MAAIDQLSRLHDSERGITAWGSLGLADLYSRKAIFVSPIEMCTKDLDLAHAYADEAIRIMPAAISFIRKGLLYTDDRMIDEAAACFDHAMKLDRDETRLSYEYVVFLAALRRFDKAIACSLEAIACDQERRIHSVNLGEIYYMAGRFTEAREQLERTEREYPDAWAAAMLLGLICLTEGDFSTARRHIDRARRLPGQGRFRRVLTGAKVLTQALIDSRAVVSLEKRNLLPGLRLAELAVFYVLRGRAADSISILETLVDCRFPSMSWMIHWPIFARLHAHSKFKEIRALWKEPESSTSLQTETDKPQLC
jgi:tetratricopeptide (TPR) repeat protein